MAIGFVSMQGQITRAQDFTTIKHNEDHKPNVDQANVVQHMTKQTEQKTTRVTNSAKSEYHQQKFDAKDKGKNEYYGDGGRERKQRDKSEEDGKVLLKGVGKQKAIESIKFRN